MQYRNLPETFLHVWVFKTVMLCYISCEPEGLYKIELWASYSAGRTKLFYSFIGDGEAVLAKLRFWKAFKLRTKKSKGQVSADAGLYHC